MRRTDTGTADLARDCSGPEELTSHTSSGLRRRRFGVPCLKELCFGRLWRNYGERVEWIDRGDARSVIRISRSAVRMWYLCVMSCHVVSCRVMSAHRHSLHVSPSPNSPPPAVRMCYLCVMSCHVMSCHVMSCLHTDIHCMWDPPRPPQWTFNYIGHSESNITFRQVEMLLSSGDQLSWFEQKGQFANTEKTTSFEHLYILTSV
jgi:hypothetical protein